MLTQKDCESYRISTSEFDCADGETRENLKALLRGIRCDTGIDPDASRMLIQLYPEKGGGCEIFVTVLAGKSTPENYHITETEENVPKCAETERAVKAKETDSRRYASDIYEFRELSSVLSLCKRLLFSKKKVWDDMSALYFAPERDSYFLIAVGGDIPPEIAGEYDGEKRRSDAVFYISEHGTAVCTRNAIETLGSVG